jgi:hypothetical protein
MSMQAFDDECPGCRPALPADDEMMILLDQYWDTEVTDEQKRAYHAVCCCDSRLPTDMALVQPILYRMEQLAEQMKPANRN